MVHENKGERMNYSVLEEIKISAKKLISEDKPTKIKKIPTLEETIFSILNAYTPARKANATRRLRLYAQSRAKEIGSTTDRVIAGVFASATKKIKC